MGTVVGLVVCIPILGVFRWSPGERVLASAIVPFHRVPDLPSRPPSRRIPSSARPPTLIAIAIAPIAIQRTTLYFCICTRVGDGGCLGMSFGAGIRKDCVLVRTGLVNRRKGLVTSAHQHSNASTHQRRNTGVHQYERTYVLRSSSIAIAGS